MTEIQCIGPGGLQIFLSRDQSSFSKGQKPLFRIFYALHGRLSHSQAICDPMAPNSETTVLVIDFLFADLNQ